MIPEDPCEFFKMMYGYEPYVYQKKLLKDNSKYISARQAAKTGKTVTCAAKGLHYALTRPNTNVFIVAPTHRQAKILMRPINVAVYAIPEIEKMLIRPDTQTEKNFSNGSRIECMTASGRTRAGGSAGDSLRGIAPHMLIVDEGAFIDDDSWQVMEPRVEFMRGGMIIISTPKADVGRFYDTFKENSGFSNYHVPATICPHITKEMIGKEKKKRTEEEFKREVLAEFVSEFDNYFPKKLIDKCIEGERHIEPAEDTKYIMSADFARYGMDETVYMIAEIFGMTLKVVNIIFTKKKPSTDAIRKIKRLHEEWKFDSIYLDESGMGGTIVDVLLEEKLPIVGCNFSHRKKWQYYKTLKFLMENNRLKFYKDSKLIEQLSCMVVKYGMQGGDSIGRVNAPLRKHDDYSDALALLCVEMEELKEEIDDGFIF